MHPDECERSLPGCPHPVLEGPRSSWDLCPTGTLGESLFGSTENPAGLRSLGTGFGHPCSIVCCGKVGGGPHRGDPLQRVSAVAKGRRTLPLWWSRHPSAAVNIIPGTFSLLISAA